MGEPLDFAKPLELVCDGTGVAVGIPDSDGDRAVQRKDRLKFTPEQHPLGAGFFTMVIDGCGRYYNNPTGPQIVRNRVEEYTADPIDLSKVPPPSHAPPRFAIGDAVHVIVKREGQPRFPGYIIGSYTPLDGRHQGWVVEHERDGIIHVYPNAALAPGLE